MCRPAVSLYEEYLQLKENNKTKQSWIRAKVWGAYGTGSVVFPGILLKSASAQLSLWIRRDEELLEDLKKAGYRKVAYIYAAPGGEILVDHLGDPESWNI